jgi:hypothetical protein
MRNPSNATFVLRISRELSCASDRGTVQIVAEVQPVRRGPTVRGSLVTDEITIQRQDFRTCQSCSGEAGFHLDTCPELLKLRAFVADGVAA